MQKSSFLFIYFYSRVVSGLAQRQHPRISSDNLRKKNYNCRSYSRCDHLHIHPITVKTPGASASPARCVQTMRRCRQSGHAACLCHTHRRHEHFLFFSFFCSIMNHTELAAQISQCVPSEEKNRKHRNRNNVCLNVDGGESCRSIPGDNVLLSGA